MEGSDSIKVTTAALPTVAASQPRPENGQDLDNTAGEESFRGRLESEMTVKAEYVETGNGHQIEDDKAQEDAGETVKAAVPLADLEKPNKVIKDLKSLKRQSNPSISKRLSGLQVESGRAFGIGHLSGGAKTGSGPSRYTTSG